MQRALPVLALVLVAACKRESGDSARTAVENSAQVAPGPRPHDLAAASSTLACVIAGESYHGMFVATALADFASLPLVRMAARLAIARARTDGPASLEDALGYEAGVLWGRDDVEGLREVFALIDTDPSGRHNYVFSRGGPQRARAGIAPTASELEANHIMIVRELALAGNRDRALQLLGTITDANLPRNTDPIDYIGALAATGQIDRARQFIANDQGGYRVKLAGAWLETALRAGGPIAEPLATLAAEIRRGDDGDVWRFDAAAVLRRARILHREHELAPMLEALKPRLGALFRSRRTTDDAYQLAVVTGDVTAIVAAGGATADLAKNLEVARGPLDRAFATALTMPDSSALLRVWARWLEAGAEPVLGAKLTAALCPVTNRAPATPATGVLSATQVELPKQSECAPHDVVLTLKVGGAVRATRTLGGVCTGACTPAQKRAGAAEKARIDREISSGTLDPAAANYSFTGCSFVGFELDEVQIADNRQFAILSQHYQEAHDTDVTKPRVAFEMCGDIYISDPIYVNLDMPWETPNLDVAVEHDVVVVRSISDRGSDVVLRLVLPTCRGVQMIVD